jgi:transcriptional regulator with XRE-family HTH domain
MPLKDRDKKSDSVTRNQSSKKQPLKNGRPPSSRTIIRTRTLEELGAILLNDGVRKAEERYQSYLKFPHRDFAFGNESVYQRQTMRRQGHFEYIWQGPPSRFDPPYVILEVVVDTWNEKFMSHGGEEILYVLSGPDITYEFFFPDTLAPWLHSLPPKEIGQTVDADGKKFDVAPGTLVRINSSIPHRNSLAGDGIATAWIILKPLSGTPASLLVRPHTDELSSIKFRRSRKSYEQENIPFLREFSEADLKEMDLGNYILVASGLSEKLALHRKRAELPEEKLAQECGLNESYVRRLERRQLRNVSIPTLLDLAEPIDADVSTMISALDWIAVWKKQPPNPAEQAMIAGLTPPDFNLHDKPEPRPHYLHPSVISLRVGDSEKRFDETQNIDDLTSVIVLEGEIVIGFEGGDGTKRRSKVLLEAGQVFHARHNFAFQAEAHKNARLLVIRYSGECSCQPDILS